MGLTDKGFERMTYEDILTDLEAKAQELFGADIDTGEQTALGKFIRILAHDRATTEEQAEMIYYARFPNLTNGVNIDRLCPFVGISRNPATRAQYEVKVTGTAGYTVEYGFEVSTDSDVTFYNTLDTVIGEDGTCIITVESVESGTVGNVDVESITEIVNPAADIESIIGVSVVNVGTDEESDAELRQRFAQASAGSGSCNETALEAALIRVPTVTSSNVIVNDTDETDTGGRPPHSFTCFVTGGVGYEQEIAETIFDKKPIGIKTHGALSRTVTDDSGAEHTIYFSRTANIDIYVKITIATTAVFEGETGKENIKDNIRAYINALGVGGDVILSAMYSYIHSVAGVQEVKSLTLSKDGTNYSAGNITVSDVQSAVCKAVEVTVQ